MSAYPPALEPSRVMNAQPPALEPSRVVSACPSISGRDEP